ncbi:MAG: hypothetical protein H6718_03230 [Polyangiaceae bacterium]|nr:hypothetical protein [Myxococcales bacterium]MCB9584379.1 hypothetical protein [Polyangiaceae bacterium]
MSCDRAVGHWRTGRRKPLESSRIRIRDEFGIPVEYWELPATAAKRDKDGWIVPDGTEATAPPTDPPGLAVLEMLKATDRAATPAERHRRLADAIGGIADFVANDERPARSVKRLRQIRDALQQIAADEAGPAESPKPARPQRQPSPRRSRRGRSRDSMTN